MKRIIVLTSIFCLLFSYNVFGSDLLSGLAINRLDEYIDSMEEEKQNVLQDSIGYIVADNEQMEDIKDFEEDNQINNSIENTDSEYVTEYRIIIIYALGCISGFLMSIFMLKWLNK